MTGWITLFALMFAITALSALFGPSSAPISLKIETLLSGTLLLACVITRVARGRV